MCFIQHVHSSNQDGDYGLGRDRLPANVAVPLVQVAKKINAKPFMEYALSYALYNYKMVCPCCICPLYIRLLGRCIRIVYKGEVGALARTYVASTCRVF